jgi:hypothetical protein
MQKFCVSATSDKIWNYLELIHFLSSNQNKKIQIDIVPEAICLQNIGLYRLLDCFSFQQVIITTWNPLEAHDVYTVELKGNNSWFNSTHNISEELKQWNLNKIFLCLYHRPTAARLGIASHAKQYHSENAHIHFSTSADSDSIPQFELDKLLSWDPESICVAGNMIKQLPLELSGTKYYTSSNGYNYQDPLTKLYQDIMVDLVVESHVSGNTFFPTEKTIRPMLLKKPFVIFGSKDYLAYLRQMGFRTFADFWDEDYDGYQGKERYLRTIKLIDHIATLPKEKLETMYWDMQYTLDYNYHLLIDKKYKNKIVQI